MKLTLSDIQVKYEEYLADFDPTPLYCGDDYLIPMDKDDWMEYESIEVI
jgi:hypothetical protein